MDHIKSLELILRDSQALPVFKAAVVDWASGHGTSLIQSNLSAPPVKVLRVVMKLLEERPDLPIESVKVDGRSGCSHFTGHLIARPGDTQFDFEWDCAWRAEQEGWEDAFGSPDQARAARTFGYQCFRLFEASRKSQAAAK
ncbi:MAG: hypothetical protein V2A74_01595 [bacterium]